VDPEVAVGYDYTVLDGGPLFASVYIPAALPNGDRDFVLAFDGQQFALSAGESFSFTDVVAQGVGAFRLSGIDVSEALDPADARGFVTGLGFVGMPDADVALSMVPITQAVPEPATWASLMLGLAGMGAMRARRAARRPDEHRH
jgi:hypothetical protein